MRAWGAGLGLLLLGGCLRLSVDENREWPCETTKDCAPGEICVGGDTQHCELEGACNDSSDCSTSSPQICRDQRCIVSECNATFQSMCAPYICDTFTGTCAKKCSFDHDCQSTHRCEIQECVLKCTGIADCPAKHYCTSYGECVSACNFGQECGTDNGVNCGTCYGSQICCATVVPSCLPANSCPF